MTPKIFKYNLYFFPPALAKIYQNAYPCGELEMELKKEVNNMAGQPQEIRGETPMVKTLEPVTETKITIHLPLFIGIAAIVTAGVFTGYVLAQVKGGSRGAAVNGSTTIGAGWERIVGVKDEKTFKDNAEGTLREGGIDGEGSHHLERAGGASQNVYLTSSTVPLDDYIGKKIKVWGETFAAEHAGWLMDVGRLELLE